MFTIKIQSFIGVITNSSTSVFAVATKQTVDTIREILQIFLGDNADTLFTIRLRSDQYQELLDDDEYNTVQMYGTEDEFIRAYDGSDDYNPMIYVEVTTKDDSPTLKKVAQLFTSLNSTYDLDYTY